MLSGLVQDIDAFKRAANTLQFSPLSLNRKNLNRDFSESSAPRCQAISASTTGTLKVAAHTSRVLPC